MGQVRLPEVQGTQNADALTVAASTVEFGLGGDDTLTGANPSGGNTYIGGTGNDNYVIHAGTSANIDDVGGGIDTITFEGVNSLNTTFKIINNAHLEVYDSTTNTFVIILDWQSEGSKIETLKFADSTYTAGGLQGSIIFNPTSTQYKGTSTFTAEHILPAGASEADLNEAIAFYKARSMALDTGSNDLFHATAGADNIVGTAGPDNIAGLDGNDSIQGGIGNDTIQGNQGADSLEGGANDDLIRAGKDNDYAQGNLGNDTVAGDLGDDLVRGGQDNDSVYGGQGNDTLAGDLGNDNVSGDLGNDKIYGGQGNDIMLGGDGNDTIYGDKGNDTMAGGAGADNFVFAAGSGVDVITDFVHGVDHIQVSNAVLALGTLSISGNVITFDATDSVTVQGVTTIDPTSDIQFV